MYFFLPSNDTFCALPFSTLMKRFVVFFFFFFFF